MASSAGSTISLRAAQDVVMYSDQPTTSLFSKTVSDVYTDFAYSMTEIPPDGHNGVYQSNIDLKFDPTGLGDSILSLYLHAALPAIEPSGTATDAYYCQNAGYAMILDFKLKNGTQEMLKHTARQLYHFYQTRSDFANDSIDSNIFRYKLESQLQTQSACNSLMHVPILLSCTRPDRPDNSFPLTTFYHSTIRFVLRLQPLVNFTVNVGNTDAVPNLYGSTAADIANHRGTPLTGDTIRVRLFACFHLLDDSERLALANSNYFRLWYQMDELEVSSPLATDAGKQINVTQTAFNGPSRAFMLAFLPDQYTDGQHRSPNGVGLKNYFDYSAVHGGESLYEIQMKINGSEILDSSIPSTLLREQRWRECYNRPNYSMIYLIPLQPNLNEDSLIHTINPSAIDKFTFHCRKNQNASGTLVVLQDKVNCVVADQGVGGVPYQ